ncbi:NETI motif-containing protein [Saliterribacillus persicus]|nr:NETI motif-containing protein [Saliterribacillus persicus]
MARIEEAGFKPVRRMEKPIFKEMENGFEPVEREIIFECISLKDER